MEIPLHRLRPPRIEQVKLQPRHREPRIHRAQLLADRAPHEQLLDRARYLLMVGRVERAEIVIVALQPDGARLDARLGGGLALCRDLHLIAIAALARLRLRRGRHGDLLQGLQVIAHAVTLSMRRAARQCHGLLPGEPIPTGYVGNL